MMGLQLCEDSIRLRWTSSVRCRKWMPQRIARRLAHPAEHELSCWWRSTTAVKGSRTVNADLSAIMQGNG